MYTSAQLEKLRNRLPDADNNDLIASLDDAESAILNRRFPFAKGDMPPLEPKYFNLQLRLAVVLYNKIGAEGESAHSEAGVSRTYESLESLLREVTPMGVVM